MSFTNKVTNLLIVIWIGCYSIIANAEAVLDGTVGDRTAGETLYGNMQVLESDGSRVGNNLFHSFATLNVNEGESLYFSGSTGISNIISRVTGDSASNIRGVLGSTIENADLWLINPNGIVFSKNASIDVNGSFFASTADYLKLGENGRFDASNPKNDILTVDPPSSFGFLKQGEVSNAPVIFDDVAVSIKKSNTEFSVVGGRIELKGKEGDRGTILATPNGYLSLVATAGNGEVSRLGKGEYDTTRVGSFSDISIRDHSALITDQRNLSTSGGKIYIRGNNFVLENSDLDNTNESKETGPIKIELDGNMRIVGIDSHIFSFSSGDGVSSDIEIDVKGQVLLGNHAEVMSSGGGNIRIKADELEISDSSNLYSQTKRQNYSGDIELDINKSIYIRSSIQGETDFGTGITASVLGVDPLARGGDVIISTDKLVMENGLLLTGSSNSSLGNSGSLRINVNSLDMKNRAIISSNNLGTGEVGNITINASDYISIDGEETEILGLKVLEGNGSDINIATKNLSITNGAKIGSNSMSGGNGGNVTIDVDEIRVHNGHISAIALSGSDDIDLGGNYGKGGNININASKSLTVEADVDPDANLATIATTTLSYGDAGTITINSPEIFLKNSVISADSSSIAIITGDPKAISHGNAGSIQIKSDHIKLEKSTISSGTSEYTTGNAGQISVDASIEVNLSDASYIGSDSMGTGDAGRVVLNSPNITLDGESKVATFSTNKGVAGVVDIKADNLNLIGGSIITSTTLGEDKGGEVNMEIGKTLLITGVAKSNDAASRILSTAEGSGDGGNVNIQAKDIVIRDGGYISASSKGKSNAGSINLFVKRDLLLENSKITTESNQAAGGNINLNFGNSINLLGSTISTNAQGASIQDTGGDINIGKSIEGNLIFLKDGNIFAKANAGNGGAINLRAGQILLTPASEINADSQKAIDGRIDTSGPVADLTSSTALIELNFLDVGRLLNKQCQINAIADRSSFVIDKSRKINQSSDHWLWGKRPVSVQTCNTNSFLFK